MTIKEFLDHSQASPLGFANACDINPRTLWTYIARRRTPSLRASIKMVMQSGGMITFEDLLRSDEPLLWKKKDKLIKRSRDKVKKSLINGFIRKAHYRKAYYKVIDNL